MKHKSVILILHLNNSRPNFPFDLLTLQIKSFFHFICGQGWPPSFLKIGKLNETVFLRFVLRAVCAAVLSLQLPLSANSARKYHSRLEKMGSIALFSCCFFEHFESEGFEIFADVKS